MATSNMVTITSSLVKSPPKFLLNHQCNGSNTCNGNGKLVHGAEVVGANTLNVDPSAQAGIPSNHEPYLCLKAREICDLEMRVGIKPMDEPQIKVEDNGCYNLKVDVMGRDNDSETLSTKSSSIEQWSGSNDIGEAIMNQEVLVVVGCKVCIMYYLVPKKDKCCFKCGSGGLIRFDSSKN